MTSIFARVRVSSTILFFAWACASQGGEPVDIYQQLPVAGGAAGGAGAPQDAAPPPVDTGAAAQGGAAGIDSGAQAGASGSTSQPICGNGVMEEGEQCDGPDLGNERCVTLGYGDGLLGCDPESCTYDISMCNRNQDSGPYGNAGATSTGGTQATGGTAGAPGTGGNTP